jgi:hypothetical protein
MSDNLSNFMVDLASDPDKMARFMSNPLDELDDSLLTAPERAVVLSRDGVKLQVLLRLLKTNGSQSGGFKKGKRVKKKPARKGGKKKAPSRKKK